MASSNRASPSLFLRSENGGSVSSISFDEEEELGPADRDSGGVEMSNSRNRSGSPGGNFQGVLGLARLAVSFYLKDDLHLDPAETAVITGFASLPWFVKPLYGFISDSFPLFGYREGHILFYLGFLEHFHGS